MYWEKNVETMNCARLEKMQLAQLKDTIGRAGKSFYYSRTFKEKGLNVNSVKSLNDINKFPFTNKDDLREHWPYGFIAVPKEELVRMHSSSGTTGRATVVFHTANDITVWANLLARCMYMAGMRKSDVFQNMMTYGLFTGALDFITARKKSVRWLFPQARGTPNVKFN